MDNWMCTRMYELDMYFKSYKSGYYQIQNAIILKSVKTLKAQINSIKNSNASMATVLIIYIYSLQDEMHSYIKEMKHI